MPQHFYNALRAPLVTDDSSNGYAIGSEWDYPAKGQVFKCVDATIGAAIWVLGGLDVGVLAIGNYLIQPGLTGASDSTWGSTAPNGINFTPVYVAHRMQFDRIVSRCTTQQAGGAIRVGIYSHDGTTKSPGALILDAGEIDLASGNGDRSVVITQNLNTGWAWLAHIVKQATSTMPTMRRVSGTVFGIFPNTDFTEIGGSGGYRYLTGAQAYGALPAVPPALTRSTGGDCVILGLRRSA